MRRLIERVGVERFSRWEERVRTYAVAHLPTRWVTGRYSQGRETFLHTLRNETVDAPYDPPEAMAREVWGVTFQSPLMNAAGMFKTGACYDLVADQGAGAYLAGTFTPEPRAGNDLWGVKRPFLPLPRSGASLNSLGLPNPGFREGGGAERRREQLGYEGSAREILASVETRPGVPLGASVMGTPQKTGEDGYAEEIVEGLEAVEAAGVDFAEINESCPNTDAELPQDAGIETRLQHVADRFLEGSDLPVVVKFSTDTPPGQVEHLVDLLIDCGFHGVNFGNTSEAYSTYRDTIRDSERGAYDAFIDNIGGGIGGRPIRERSLELATRAVERVNERDPDRDFLVVRTGGVETQEDIEASEQHGIGMNQWFTGYWDSFADHGHDVYRAVLPETPGSRI
ncbi:MAG: hypothetical protein SVW02_00520 [Candidatus Nanohaloarchaea archaeon]|nr:hypothetical protein [Candidatus Nanohaloarchaea archaeon]